MCQGFYGHGWTQRSDQVASPGHLLPIPVCMVALRLPAVRSPVVAMTRSTAHPDLAVVRHVTSRRGTIAIALLVSVIAALPLLVRVDAVSAGSAGTVTGIAVWCACVPVG